MTIEFTIEILKQLIKKDLDQSDYILLNIISYQEEAFINEYIGLNNKNKLTLQSLHRKGLIVVSPEEDKMYMITSKGEEVLGSLKELSS